MGFIRLNFLKAGEVSSPAFLFVHDQRQESKLI